MPTGGAQDVIDHCFDKCPGRPRVAEQHSKIARRRQEIDHHVDLKVAANLSTGNAPNDRLLDRGPPSSEHLIPNCPSKL